MCAVYEFNNFSSIHLGSGCVQVRCVAESEGQVFDLSALMLPGSHNVLVSSSISDSAIRSATFYINICRPVAQQDDVRCPADASVCRKDSAETFVVSCPDTFWL